MPRSRPLPPAPSPRPRLRAVGLALVPLLAGAARALDAPRAPFPVSVATPAGAHAGSLVLAVSDGGPGEAPLVFVGYNGRSPQLLTLRAADGADVLTDHAASMGLSALGAANARSVRAAAFGDFDGDGDDDLLVGYAPGGAAEAPALVLRLWRRDGARFTDVTRDAGLTIAGVAVRQPVWVDADDDGDLDLFVAYRDRANALYRNDDGRFTDVAAEIGLADTRRSVGAVWADLDRDGDLDVVVGNMDGDANGVFRNDGGRFTDVADAWGLAWGGRTPRDPAHGTVRPCADDVNGDGRLDLVFANYGPPGLFLARADGTWEDAGDAWGITTDGRHDACALGDADGDGDLDLFINGTVTGGHNWPDRWYRNAGTRFEEAMPPALAEHAADHGTLWADADGDGREELWLAGQAPLAVVRPVAEDASAVRSVRVVVTDARGRALRAGAEVRAYAGGSRRLLATRLVDAGSGYDGQSRQAVHLALPRDAEARAVDVEVTWPAGGTRHVVRTDAVPADGRTLAVAVGPVGTAAEATADAASRGATANARADAPPAGTAPRTTHERRLIPGLERPVEILVDAHGIAHIYAETEHDLFFAQGWSAARDRLFQFEVWRRQATGTVAEWLGEREVARDHGARLFRFRGDLDAELAHYHPRGGAIVRAFTDGVNAAIAEARRDPTTLPLEFRLLGTVPEPWTPDVVISRHAGLLANVGDELDYGRAVHAIGADAVRRIARFGPRAPRLALDSAVDGAHLSHDILALYDAFRRPVAFRPEHLVDARDRAGADAAAAIADTMARAVALAREARRDIGSNNWVVAGTRTSTGWPMLANDPHRAITAPSLRYFAHLVGPGWNVIGGGEPTIPGISIGHNEHGAWGLTIFETDAEDLYVYETHPDDAARYRYRGAWERMREIVDTIPVQGAAARIVTLRYTRHGPVVYADSAARIAYAVRAAWMETGGAPYLASLRMDQARTWEEFVEACRYSHIPAENMVWADRRGTIGWQAVGIAPVRRAWDGLVPVPGDGRYEWEGYLPIPERPHEVNPARGFIATANANLVDPFTYRHMDAIGFEWADPFRQNRINEVLAQSPRVTLADMVALQHDVLSLPARTLVPMLARIAPADELTRRARDRVLAWDRRLAAESPEAGVYVAWERALVRAVSDVMVPPAVRPTLGALDMSRTIDFLVTPPPEFAQLVAGGSPLDGRDTLLARTFREAVTSLRARFGDEPASWRYGQAGYKHARVRHPLSAAVNDSLRARLEVGPAPRGGNAYTVLAAGNSDNQTSGASFRLFVDTEDWERALGMNVPGQAGDPDSPHYRDLFARWAGNDVFPLPYARERVEQWTTRRVRLTPAP